jgi:glucosyl-dolichyl phosphate glucuronosyltransferase
MNVSVVVCTWNRCHLLFQTLERMASALRVPAGIRWELLVVNNGCTDDTDRVIDAFRDRLPIRRLFEPKQGHSHARNLAVLEAAGEYIVWTDDDVLVDAQWLEAYCQAFARRPGAAVFGGAIEPWFPGRRPAWLEQAWRQVSGAYAARDLGATEIPLAVDRLPYGANMAVRTQEQKRFRYDPQLGHSGTGKVGGEETVVLRAILAGGAEGWWVPEARLRHFIPDERQTVEYLRSYYFGRGQRLHLDEEPHRWRRWGVPGWIIQGLVGESAYCLGRLLDRPEMWVRGLRRGSTARGFLNGCLPRVRKSGLDFQAVTGTREGADAHARR